MTKSVRSSRSGKSSRSPVPQALTEELPLFPADGDAPAQPAAAREAPRPRASMDRSQFRDLLRRCLGLERLSLEELVQVAEEEGKTLRGYAQDYRSGTRSGCMTTVSHPRDGIGSSECRLSHASPIVWKLRIEAVASEREGGASEPFCMTARAWMGPSHIGPALPFLLVHAGCVPDLEPGDDIFASVAFVAHTVKLFEAGDMQGRSFGLEALSPDGLKAGGEDPERLAVRLLAPALGIPERTNEIVASSAFGPIAVAHPLGYQETKALSELIGSEAENGAVLEAEGWLVADLAAGERAGGAQYDLESLCRYLRARLSRGDLEGAGAVLSKSVVLEAVGAEPVCGKAPVAERLGALLQAEGEGAATEVVFVRQGAGGEAQRTLGLADRGGKLRKAIRIELGEGPLISKLSLEEPSGTDFLVCRSLAEWQGAATEAPEALEVEACGSPSQGRAFARVTGEWWRFKTLGNEAPAPLGAEATAKKVEAVPLALPLSGQRDWRGGKRWEAVKLACGIALPGREAEVRVLALKVPEVLEDRAPVVGDAVLLGDGWAAPLGVCLTDRAHESRPPEVGARWFAELFAIARAGTCKRVERLAGEEAGYAQLTDTTGRLCGRVLAVSRFRVEGRECYRMRTSLFSGRGAADVQVELYAACEEFEGELRAGEVFEAEVQLFARFVGPAEKPFGSGLGPTYSRTRFLELVRRSAERCAAGQLDPRLMPLEKVFEAKVDRLDVFLDAVLTGAAGPVVYRELLWWRGILYRLSCSNKEPLGSPVFDALKQTGVSVVEAKEEMQHWARYYSPRWLALRPGARIVTEAPEHEEAIAKLLPSLASPAAFFDPEGRLAKEKARFEASLEKATLWGHDVQRSCVNGAIAVIDGMAAVHEDPVERACADRPWEPRAAILRLLGVARQGNSS